MLLKSTRQRAGQEALKPTLDYDTILVTGGAGFIGSHTVDALLSLGAETIDDLSTGSKRNLKTWKGHSGLHFKVGSITNYPSVDALTRKVDAIIHLTAISSPAISLKRPKLTNAVNVLGTLNLLQAAAHNHVQRFVFASSAAIYGNTTERKSQRRHPYVQSALTGSASWPPKSIAKSTERSAI